MGSGGGGLWGKLEPLCAAAAAVAVVVAVAAAVAALAAVAAVAASEVLCQKKNTSMKI